MDMHQTGPWRWCDPYSDHHFQGEEAHRAALSLRQEALKHELLRMRQQQLVAARRERYHELRAQVQQLEQQLHHYELKASIPVGVGSKTSWTNSTGMDSSLPFAQFDQRLPGSNETLIAKLVQQNEQIMALLLPRRQYMDSVRASDIPSTSTVSPPASPSSKTDSTCDSQSLSVQNAEDEKASKLAQHKMQTAVPAKSFAQTLQAPSALSWLPEFEWTDEDEVALDKLENDVDIDIPRSDNVNDENNKYETGASTNTATIKTNAPKDQKARDRFESRKKLEALLSASLKNVGGGALRKPRWRLEAEAESEVSPFMSDAEAMEPLQVFRSAVLSVLFVVNLREMLMAKKLAEKESAMRDFESMLRVYFDATRMWLGKVVRTPLLSLLQDASLDADISTRSGLTGFSVRGFAKKFGDILARRPPPPAQSLTSNGQLSESVVDPTKLLKLKVRMRGILQALSKAIEKKEVPSGILDFWKRISTDGVYFPPSYQLFNEERQSLEFDALGATRRMNFAGSTLVGQNENWRNEEFASRNDHEFSRFNVVTVNFLLVRILIPHVILQPWNVGIGSKNIGKQTAANLTSLATLLYCVCRQLSPLPAPAEHSETSFLGRRRSKTGATSQPSSSDGNPVLSEIDPALIAAEPQEEEHSADTSFMSIDEIGRRLMSDKIFPSEDSQVVQVVKEHHILLQETLIRLRSQLHGSQV
ncbi:hypothetical protein PC129_g86 [Phytophthora cactorum]|uniref:Uncharacterized protein n=1 Tax=Phytophthora cactorum TaxID=29920 RepID=A0A8T1LRN0_9STRA|nr:hypothetical protein Pcac1_g21860 [Phytophthora cactorum]KAG2848923.1 hypothetical protein PC112_g488 [Phytophthora cactorum]KAG2849030.1 hypothetical protein PC111_g139 [Phytophthora cactorum]KAG2868950.1 hypothetical protein PC113_g572 [Phytophthora cactorum]KAG2934733.1 hypothetical protein PC114_g859 [Phytophthora cactorum]